MTLKEQVREAIQNAYPSTLTNAQLSFQLSAPEPSVRRATLELVRAERIREHSGGYAGLPIQWKGLEPVRASNPAPSC